jgi:hypothetical protein
VHVEGEQIVFTRPGYRGEWVAFIPWNKWQVVTDWCTNMLGPGGNNKKCKWRPARVDQDRIYIRTKEDAVLFQLTWAGN